LMLMLWKRSWKKVKEKENIFLCSATVNNIVSTTSTLSLNELNQNKQQKFTHTSMTQTEIHSCEHNDDGLMIPQLYEDIKEPALKREDNCQSEYRHSSCD
jgi:hypothetical protein